MRTLFYLFLFISQFSFPIKATLIQTDTHGYVLSALKNCVLAINLKTGEETKIPVGSDPGSMVIHGEKGYVWHYNANSIYVLNLRENIVIHMILDVRCSKGMWIHGQKGYVLSWIQDSVTVIDLIKDEVIKTMSADGSIGSFTIFGDFGYAVNTCRNSICIFDLKTDSFEKPVFIPERPEHMRIYKDKGYILHADLSFLSVFDLNTDRLIDTIIVQSPCRYMTIQGDHGYVLHSRINLLSVIDLKNECVIKTISLPLKPESIVIDRNKGYVTSYDPNVVSVVNLKTDRVMASFKKVGYDLVDVCYPYVYIGICKVAMVFDSALELEDHIQRKVAELPTQSYKDLLTTQEIAEFLNQATPALAFQLLFSLYQPLTFLKTPEGRSFFNSLQDALYAL